jgi:quercetin dioxygenase-like cupin family protein
VGQYWPTLVVMGRYRHPLPAVLVSLPAITTAIAEHTGHLGERGDQKILITYQYGTREQIANVSWQPLARSGNKHFCVTPYGLDVAVFDNRAKQDRHYHRTSLELHRVLEGTLTIWVGGVKHTIPAGEEILVAPYAVHEVVTETPFIAMVIVANTTGTGDKFLFAPWTVPDSVATPGVHLQPIGAKLAENGAKEIFRHGTDLCLTAFDDRCDGKNNDNKPSTRLFSVLQGSMTLDVNAESYDLHAGDTIVVFPQVVHQWRSSGHFLAELMVINCR